MAATSGAMDPADPVRIARAVLSRVAEPAGRALWDLVERCGPVAAVGELRRRADHGRPVPGTWATRATDEQARVDLAAVAALGGRLAIPEDADWPAEQLVGLRHIHADDSPTMPPLALWARGPASLAEVARRGVAVVGARASSAYGNHVAGELGFALAEAGCAVVSGGAYGIDGAAHRGALAAGGRTVAVLACGVDRAYPPGHSALLERIAADGLILSEWPPGTTPQRWRFLVRNRLIAALSLGTVVVEAGARSGARQTARRADELSRPVLAVPGPVTSAMSVGTHRLIREAGAVLVTGAADVLAEVRGLGESPVEPVRGARRPRDRLGTVAARVLEAVPARGVADLASIAGECGVAVLDVVRELSGLAELGLVVRAADGSWSLTELGHR